MQEFSTMSVLWGKNKTKARKSSSMHWHLIKKLLPVFKSTVNSCWGIYTGFILKRYGIKSENVCRCICAYILKTVQKDVVWFHVYLILPDLLFNYCYLISTVPSKRRGVGVVHCTRVPLTLAAPGWLSEAEGSAYLLSLVPLLGLGQVLCLGRQVLRLLVVVRLLALLAVATHTLLAILRWDLLGKPSKANAWAEAEGHQIKLCPIHLATSAEVTSSATHLTPWSDSFTQQFMGALRSSCLSRRSKHKYSA